MRIFAQDRLYLGIVANKFASLLLVKLSRAKQVKILGKC